MAQNYINSGDTFEYTIPSATTIVSGDVVVMGGVVGIALGGGTETEEIRVRTQGVFTVSKLTTSGNSFAIGARVYYDTTAKKATSDATKTFIGYAYEAEIQAATTVDVLLAAAPTAGGAAGVTPEDSPTITATGAVATNSKTDIDTELGKVKADLDAIVAALEAAGVFVAP